MKTLLKSGERNYEDVTIKLMNYNDRELTADELDEFLYTIIKTNEFYSFDGFIIVFPDEMDFYSKERAEEMVRFEISTDEDPSYDNILKANAMINEFRQLVKENGGTYKVKFDNESDSKMVFFIYKQ